MIKKTLLTFLFLSIIYSVFWGLYSPRNKVAQEYWEENQIKAQDFLYGDMDSIDNVIVGTSLSCALIMDGLPKTYNLSLKGEIPYKGLEVLIQKQIYPKRVFIETNRIFSWYNEGLFEEILYNPALNPLRKHISIMRDGRQPLILLATTLENGFIADHSPYIMLYDRSALYGHELDQNDSLAVNRSYPDYSNRPNAELVEASMTSLKHYINILKEHNTEVIMFEMPISDALCEMPKSISTREYMEEYFPSSQYLYLPFPGCNGYKTYDGAHLTEEEALLYTSFFKTQIDSLVNIGK